MANLVRHQEAETTLITFKEYKTHSKKSPKLDCRTVGHTAF